jgi:hypothetical protein
MRKFIVLVSVLLLVTASFGAAMAQPEEKVPKKKILIHRYNVVFYQMERLRIGMDAVIDYAQEINASTDKLIELRDEFVAKEAELNQTAVEGDFVGFKGVLAHIKGIVKEFRIESHAVLGDNIGEAKVRVANAWQENKEYLKTLIDNISKSKKEADLEKVEEAIEDAEEKVDKLEERGANVTPLREKIEEIKEKKELLREKLEAAIESCKGVGLGACNTTEAEEYRALRDEIRQEFRELKEIAKDTGKKVAIARVIEASERIIEKTKERLEKLEERGVDVTVPLAKLEEVEELLDSAEEKYEAGDYEGAKEDLKAVRKAFKSVRDEIRENIKKKIETLKEQRKSLREQRKLEPKEEEEEFEEEEETEEVEEAKEVAEEAEEVAEKAKEIAEEAREAARGRP